MEFIIELPPYSKCFIDSVLAVFINRLNSVFIPCTPAGVPMIDCFSAGVYVSEKYRVSVYTSLRTRDYTLNHVFEKLKTAYEYGFRGVLITRGDPPKYGDSIEGLDTETVVYYARQRGIKVPIGIVLSMKYSVKDILKRAETIKPDFSFIIRYEPRKLHELVEIVENLKPIGIKIYPFILLGTPKNIPLFNELGQPFIELEKLNEVLRSIKDLVDGVILSSPMDIERVLTTSKINYIK